MATTHQALVLRDFQELIKVEEQKIPSPETGSVVVKVLAAYILDYTGQIFNGKLGYPLTLPQTPGGSCIGRVSQTGPDTTVLSEGQLVLCDPTIHARDDPATQFLLGIHSGFSPGSIKLMEGTWRNGSLAEFVKMPLENVFALNEEALCKKQGYTIEELPLLQTLMIPYGGLDDSGVKVGDTVIVAPATGNFGGAAVAVALSMGANVVACGRKEDSLSNLTAAMGPSASLKTVKLTSDVQADNEALRKVVGSKGADVYIDFSPPAAGEGGKTPSHMVSCLGALKTGGTASYMGGISGNVTLPYSLIVFNKLTIRGTFMYGRRQAEQIIKMAENGKLKLGKAVGTEVVGPYGLHRIEEALKMAADLPGWSRNVVFVP